MAWKDALKPSVQYVATDTEPYNDHARMMLAARNDDGFKLLYENHAAAPEA